MESSSDTIEIERSSHIFHSSSSGVAQSSYIPPEPPVNELDIYRLLKIILDVYDRDRAYDNRLVLSKIVSVSFWRLPIIGQGRNFIVRDGYSDLPGGSIYSSRKTVKYIQEDGSFKLPRMVTKQIRVYGNATQEESQKVIDHVCLELRALTHHPLKMHENIVDFHGLMWEQEDSGRILPVLLIEKADYGTLSDLQEQTQLDFSTKMELCYDVAKGLEALHACGVAHCDVSLL